MQINTYRNERGNPIVRKCANCKNWKALNNEAEQGYCGLIRLRFAYTLEHSMYATTKKFNLCDSHELFNEDIMREQSEQASYGIDFLKNKAPQKDESRP